MDTQIIWPLPFTIAVNVHMRTTVPRDTTPQNTKMGVGNVCMCLCWYQWPCRCGCVATRF